MPQTKPYHDDALSFEDVVQYMRDMSGELAAMAHGAGLAEAARALARARELCEQALKGGG